MVDLTEQEKAAIRAAMRPVAEIMAEIGWTTPLNALTPDLCTAGTGSKERLSPRNTRITRKEKGLNHRFQDATDRRRNLHFFIRVIRAFRGLNRRPDRGFANRSALNEVTCWDNPCALECR